MSLKIHEDDDKQNVISISKVIYMDVLWEKKKKNLLIENKAWLLLVCG